MQIGRNGGGGGNRTRVLKRKDKSHYMRSLFIVVVAPSPIDRIWNDHPLLLSLRFQRQNRNQPVCPGHPELTHPKHSGLSWTWLSRYRTKAGTPAKNGATILSALSTVGSVSAFVFCKVFYEATLHPRHATTHPARLNRTLSPPK